MKFLIIEKKCSKINSNCHKRSFGSLRMTVLFLFFLLSLGVKVSHAQEIIDFGPKETRIDGSIPYIVIGKYKAHFKAFKGKIIVDQASGQIHSVFLDIKVGSISSNCPWCDKIVKSRKLLNPAKYSSIIFKSERITHDSNGYKVRGLLTLHGVTRPMSFPFKPPQ